MRMLPSSTSCSAPSTTFATPHSSGNVAYRRQGKTLRHTEHARDLKAVRDALVEDHAGRIVVGDVAGNYPAQRMVLGRNSGPISHDLHEDTEDWGGEPHLG